MQLKRSIWFPLALAMALASAPVFGYTAEEGGAPPPPPTQEAQPSQPPGGRAQQPRPQSSPDERDLHRTAPATYRLTYTLTEFDGAKRVGSQHYAFVLDPDGPPAHVDLGASLPSSNSGGMNYPSGNIGLKMDARLRQFANGLELSTSVTQTEIAGGKGSMASPDANVAQDSKRTAPVFRQSQLKTVAILRENKSIILGQLDKPDSTHSLQIQVELSRVQ